MKKKSRTVPHKLSSMPKSHTPKSGSTPKTAPKSQASGEKSEKKRSHGKSKMRIVPILPMLNRDVYKRLHGAPTNKKSTLAKKCGKLTKDNTLVNSMEDLYGVCGNMHVIRTTRRRAMRRFLVLTRRQLMFEQDPEKYPLSSKDKAQIEALGLVYYTDNARKIKEGSTHKNGLLSEFVTDVACNTMPNISEKAVKELSLIGKIVSETIVRKSAKMAYRVGHQTVGKDQLDCVVRLDYGPVLGQKIVNGRCDKSRSPSEHRIVSSFSDCK